MKWADFLLNKITETDLFEMTYERKVIIDKCRDLSSQICIHIVKLTCFDNPDDIRDKIFDSLYTWFNEIRKLRIYSFDKNKRLPEDDYFKYIWADKIHNLDDFEYLFLEVKKTYKEVLPIQDLKISKIYSQLTRLSKELSKALSRNFLCSPKSYFDWDKNNRVEYKR